MVSKDTTHTHTACHATRRPFFSTRVTNKAEDGGRDRAGPFAETERKIGLYACVDSAAWVKRLVALGIKDIQIRIKVRMGMGKDTMREVDSN